MALLAFPAHTFEYVSAPPEFVQLLFNQASSKTDAITEEEHGYIKIGVHSASTVYRFTTASHPCHPAVAIQRVVERDGVLSVVTHGVTAGNRSAFEQWLKALEDQANENRRLLEKSGS